MIVRSRLGRRGFCALALAVACLAPAAGEESTCLAGDPAAPVRLEVFSDFECPICGRFYRENTRPLAADFAAAGRICVVYREFPLRHHVHGRLAARYSVAAGRVSAELRRRVADLLYTGQERWAAGGDVGGWLAAALTAPELAALESHLSDPDLDAAIDADRELGKSRGVHRTPAIYLGAGGEPRILPATVEYAILRRYVEWLLARAEAGP